MAIAECVGPDAGLAMLPDVEQHLPDHHRVALVRAELLRRQGDDAGAADSYRRALELCPDGAERNHIATRLASLEPA